MRVFLEQNVLKDTSRLQTRVLEDYISATGMEVELVVCATCGDCTHTSALGIF